MIRRLGVATFLLSIFSQQTLAKQDDKAHFAPPAEIPVTLFGQPCVLSGPVSSETLKACHSISPEQLPPARTSDQARRLLEKLRKAQNIPSALERYRERLSRRLEAQIAFFNGLAAAKKSGRAADLISATKGQIPEKQAKNFEALVKKDPVASWNSAIIDQITDSYNDWIEQNPEEEFHRAIERMNIRYTCSFEESEESEEE